MQNDVLFMSMAKLVAQQSDCAKRKVGAVLVKHLNGGNSTVESVGHNHKIYVNDSKCDACCLNDDGKCVNTIHAEVDSLEMFTAERCHRYTLFVTHPPCENCVKYASYKGVHEIVFHDERGIVKQDYESYGVNCRFFKCDNEVFLSVIKSLNTVRK